VKLSNHSTDLTCEIRRAEEDNRDAIVLANLNAAQYTRACASLELAHPEFRDVHAVEKGRLSRDQDNFRCLPLNTLIEEVDHGLRLEGYFVQRVHGNGEDAPPCGRSFIVHKQHGSAE
jgi:hypothetical protein